MRVLFLRGISALSPGSRRISLARLMRIIFLTPFKEHVLHLPAHSAIWPLTLVLTACGGSSDSSEPSPTPTTLSRSTSRSASTWATRQAPVTSSATAPVTSPISVAAAAPAPAPATTLAPAPGIAPATIPALTSGPAPATAPTSSPTVALDASKTCGQVNFQQDVIALINQARASSRMCGGTFYNAAAAVRWNSKLFNAAAAHSADMASKNYFSHTGSDGSSSSQRITAAGYAWSAVGENISAGQDTVAQTMTGWLNSPGHCANIMRANYTEVGASCASSSSSSYPSYWTMDLGRP